MSEDNKITFLKVGKLIHFNAEEIKDVIESYHHNYRTAFSSKVDFLIMNEPNSQNKLYQQCSEHGVPVINETDLIWMLLKEVYQSTQWGPKLIAFDSQHKKQGVKSHWSEPDFILDNLKVERHSWDIDNSAEVPHFHFIDQELFKDENFVFNLITKFESFVLYKNLLNLPKIDISENKKMILSMISHLKNAYSSSRVEDIVFPFYSLLGLSLQTDKDIQLKLLELNPSLLDRLDDNAKNDKEIVLFASLIDLDSFRYASSSLKDDGEFVKKIIKLCMTKPDLYSSILSEVSDNLKDDREVVLYAVRRDGTELQHASVRLQNDLQVVKEAMKSNLAAFKFASEAIKEDKQLISQVINLSGKNLAWLNENYRNDMKFVEKILEEDVQYVKFAGDTLRNNETFMLKVLERGKDNGYGLLKFAGESLKNKLSFVKAAVDYDESNLAYIGENLDYDKEFALKVIAKYPKKFNGLNDHLKNDIDIVKRALEKDYQAFEFASEQLKQNKEFILELLEIESNIFKHLSKHLRADHEVIRKALNEDIDNLYFVSVEEEQLNSLEEILGTTLYKKVIARFSDYRLDELITFHLCVISNGSKQRLDALNNFTQKYNWNTSEDEVNRVIVSEKAQGIYLLLSHIDQADIVNDSQVQNLFKSILETENRQLYEQKILDLAFENKLISYSRATKHLEDFQDNPNVSSQLMEYIQTFDFEEEITSLNQKILEAIQRARLLPDQHSLEKNHVQEIKELYQNDIEVILEASKINLEIFQMALENKKLNEKEVLNVVREGNYQQSILAAKYFNDNRQIILEAVKINGRALEHADSLLKSDLEIVLEAVIENFNALEFADDSLKDDKDFALKAIQYDIDSLEYMSSQLRDDEDLLFKAAMISLRSLNYAGKKLKSNADFFMKIAENIADTNYYYFLFENNYEIVSENFSSSLKKNKEFAQKFLKLAPLSFSGFSSSITDDVKIVFEALKEDVRVYEQLSDNLKKDFQVLRIAKEANQKQKHYETIVPNDFISKTSAYSVARRVRDGNQNFNKLSKDQKLHPFIIKAALNYDGMLLSKMSATVKSNKDLVLIAVKNNGMAIKYAHDSLKSDFDVVLSAALNFGHSLYYADKTMLQNKELLSQALKGNPTEVFAMISETLREEKELIASALDNPTLSIFLKKLMIQPNLELASGKAICKDIATKYLEVLKRKETSAVSVFDILVHDILKQYYVDAEVYYEDKKRSYVYGLDGLAYIGDTVRCSGSVSSEGVIEKLIISQDEHGDFMKKYVSTIEATIKDNVIGTVEFIEQAKQNHGLLKQAIYGLSKTDEDYRLDGSSVSSKNIHGFILQQAALYYSEWISE